MSLNVARGVRLSPLVVAFLFVTTTVLAQEGWKVESRFLPPPAAASKLRSAGAIAELNVYEGMSHAEYAMLMGSPEWQQVYDELSVFLQAHLAVPALGLRSQAR